MTTPPGCGCDILVCPQSKTHDKDILISFYCQKTSPHNIITAARTLTRQKTLSRHTQTVTRDFAGTGSGRKNIFSTKLLVIIIFMPFFVTENIYKLSQFL